MVSKFSMRLPQRLPKPLTLGAIFLVSAGAIAYLNFVQHAPKSLSPAGAQLVPQTALATLTLTTDELAWTKLRQFGTDDSQEQFDAALSQWKDRLLTANGYRYKQDIKPWIGDRVTFALLPPQSAQSSGNDSQSAVVPNGGLATAAKNWVMIVPISDPLKAKALLADRDRNSPTTAHAPTASRSYKGVTVRTIETQAKTQEKETFETAVVGTSWLLLSATDEGINQAIDTQKGGRSLLDIAGYRKAASRAQAPQPPGKNFAQIYLNLPAANDVLAIPADLNSLPAQPPAQPSPPRSPESSSLLPLQGSQGIVANGLIEAEGIRFQGTSWLLPKNDLDYSELINGAGDMPRRLPSDTLVMMSGSNLQQFWQAFSDSNSSPPFFPNPQNLKAGLLAQTGLDLDEDIMPWAGGEFALGLLPPSAPAQSETGPNADPNQAPSTGTDGSAGGDSSGDLSGSLPPEDSVPKSAPLLIMVQTNDRKTAESVWAQLDDVMASRYRFQVETQQLEGGSITQWLSPFQGLEFSHGWLPGNVTFFAVGSGAADKIAPIPERSLVQSRTFETLTGQAKTPNNGNFYIDLAQINALKGGVFPLPQLSPAGPTSAIQAIGLTTIMGDRSIDYDLYVKIAKGKQPPAL